jgi:hypothetical protein
MRLSLTKLNLLLVISSFLLFMVLLAVLLAFGLDGSQSVCLNAITGSSEKQGASYGRYAATGF